MRLVIRFALASVLGCLVLLVHAGTIDAQWTEPPPAGASGGPSYPGGCCEPLKAFDGSTATFWAGDPAQNFSGGQWRLYYTYASPRSAGSSVTISYFDPYYPLSATLYVSADGRTWTQVATIPNQPTSSFTVSQSFSYLRIIFNGGNTNPPYIREITTGPPPTATPVPSPTPPYTEPPPLGASGGPQYTPNNPGICCEEAKAFDNNLNTYWAGSNANNVAGGQWRLYYNYGTTRASGTSITFNYFAPYYPSSAQLYISTNGTSWTKIADVPNQPTSSFTTSKSFSYLRVIFSAGNATPPYVKDITIAVPPTPTPTSTPSPTPTPTLIPTPTPPMVNWGLGTLLNAWYQVIGGNTYAGQTMAAIAIPTPTPRALPYFTLDEQAAVGGGIGTNPGIVACGQATGCSSYGGGLVSSMGWRVENTPFGGTVYDYNYYQNKFKNDCQFSSVGSIRANDIRTAGIHCYTVNDSNGAGLDGNVNVPAGTQSIVLVNGQLNIDKSVNIGSEGFIIFIASGDIIFDAALGSNPPANPNNPTVQGVYIASGRLVVQSTNNLSSERQFVGKGVFVGYGGVLLLRNLGNEQNADYPAEVFVYDPALVRAAFAATTGPTVLRTSVLWQQVPP